MLNLQRIFCFLLLAFCFFPFYDRFIDNHFLSLLRQLLIRAIENEKNRIRAKKAKVVKSKKQKTI